jgi:succinate dehydrogenase / fumarate reductase flavoprotein subunit
MHKRSVKGKRSQQICLKEERDYYLEGYPAFGNLVPRDIASRAAKERCDAGFELTKQAKRFIRLCCCN